MGYQRRATAMIVDSLLTQYLNQHFKCSWFDYGGCNLISHAASTAFYNRCVLYIKLVRPVSVRSYQSLTSEEGPKENRYRH